MYEKEINKLIKAGNIENLDPEILEIIKKQIEKDLKIGVENGCSVERQVDLVLELKSKLYADKIDKLKKKAVREIEISLGIREN